MLQLAAGCAATCAAGSRCCKGYINNMSHNGLSQNCYGDMHVCVHDVLVHDDDDDDDDCDGDADT